MKRIINFSYLCIAILTCSCADRGGGTSVGFTNDSSHHILMIDFAHPNGDDQYAAGIEIFPGETAKFNSTHFFIEHKTLDVDEAAYSALQLIPHGVTVVFDNEYAIRYSRDGKHKALCEIENYIPSPYSPTWWRYTYHFTDEDYEYARKHGEVIE